MKKNILVVDDSALMRRILCDIINADEMFQAKDVCKDGLEAYESLRSGKYDGVILDVNMPKVNGIELLEMLQKDNIKVTVIVVSSYSRGSLEVRNSMIESGVASFMEKPGNIIEAKGDEFKRKLLRTLSTSMKLENGRTAISERPTSAESRPAIKLNQGKGKENKLIALACSTGGPKALQSVIPYLPKNMDAPMVLVQHMPAGFTKSMAERLNEISKVHVKEAEEGDILEKGCVYVAPGGRHMEIVKCNNGRHKIVLNNAPAIGGLKPCANITYESICNTGFDQIVCVVLTGMGADGTKGITALKTKKPIYVISQNAATCVVYGMPKAVVDAGLANEVVPLTEIAQSIIRNVGVQ